MLFQFNLAREGVALIVLEAKGNSKTKVGKHGYRTCSPFYSSTVGMVW